MRSVRRPREGAYPMGDPRRPIVPLPTVAELAARTYVPRPWGVYRAVPAEEARRAVRRAVREAAEECAWTR